MDIAKIKYLNGWLNNYIYEYAELLELTNKQIHGVVSEILNEADLKPDKLEIYVDLAEIEITCVNKIKLNQIVEYLTTYTDIESNYTGMSRPDSIKLSIPDY